MSGETQTSESRASKHEERRLKRRFLMSSDSVIRVPKPLLRWRLPLVYVVEGIERNGDRVTITIRVVKEGDVNE